MAVIRFFDSVCKLYLFAHVLIAVLFDSQTGAKAFRVFFLPKAQKIICATLDMFLNTQAHQPQDAEERTVKHTPFTKGSISSHRVVNI